jgi:hypothetical protein
MAALLRYSKAAMQCSFIFKDELNKSKITPTRQFFA